METEHIALCARIGSLHMAFTIALQQGVLTRVCDEVTVFNRRDLQAALIASTHAKNSIVQRNGFTPFCATFGRHPRVPTALLDWRNDLKRDPSWAHDEENILD
eukprot:6457493-Amphidinium_carterae.2